MLDPSFQDPDDGGIADRPGDMCDVFHTVFGIAGILSFSIIHHATPFKLVDRLIASRLSWFR